MTLLARVARSSVLAPKPSTLAWRDQTLSRRRRVRSLVWFLSGGWRSAGIRLAARNGLTWADRLLTRRARPNSSAS